MKIGIMTWFRYYNYGTALQVFALYHYLAAKGHIVNVIDYIPQKKGTSDIHSYRLTDYLEMKRAERKRKPSNYMEPYETDERRFLFERFLDFSLSQPANLMSELENLNSQYQAFICGSDQIWAPTIFDPHYFLDFVADEEKMIAYAPSIGLPSIDDRFVESSMEELIRRFPHLSVREEQGAGIIKSLVDRDAEVVVDPTFLLSFDEWKKYCANVPSGTPYLLVYMLGNEKEHWEQIYRIANEKNLKVKIIPVFENDLSRDGCITSAIGPAEFLGLVSRAAYVCTDSFHGTIFSLIFRNEFSVFERFDSTNNKNQNSRIYNLLTKAGLKHRMIAFHGEYHDPGMVDYAAVQNSMDAEILKSKLFLNSALNEVENHLHIVARHVLEDHSLCCGCGACAHACPKNAIAIRMGSKGFWEASVDDDKCIRCGRCKKVCPFEGETTAVHIRDASHYSYKDGRRDILLTSSSGGFGSSVSELLLGMGYSVAGCCFIQKEKRARHTIISSPQELESFKGSKYVQSYFGDMFDAIGDSPVAVIGTPCQIAALRKNFGKKDNIVYIDLICHGVPSYLLLDRYIDYMCRRHALNKDDMKLSFRVKEKGWRERHMGISSGGKSIIVSQNEDLFFRTFEAMNCYMDTCYECRWRTSSAADIRMGDYWGPKFSGDRTGVSMVAALTPTGRKIVELLRSSGVGELCDQPADDMLAYQQTMNYPKPLYHDELLRQLRDKKDLQFITDKYNAPFEYMKENKKERIRRIIRLLIAENVRGLH